MATGFQVVIDCADPNRVATFWASALGYKLQDPPDGYATWDEFLTSIGVPEDEWNNASAVVDPDGVGPRLYFQRVPEGKVVKNRVHMDVNVGGGLKTPIEERKKRVGAEVERLKGEGATVLRPNEERGEYWVVMQDPEGNEFCLQ
jgi:catechol 2,3-dioxygenase-like lactoylglutathione lyase family enzyme